MGKKGGYKGVLKLKREGGSMGGDPKKNWGVGLGHVGWR